MLLALGWRAELALGSAPGGARVARGCWRLAVQGFCCLSAGGRAQLFVSRNERA